MENYKQFNARLHRQGQTKPVVIYHLVASKCMDERVLNVLQTKDLSQEELIKILKTEKINESI
jgi:SNF2 family DNA or RNA helicase